MCSLRSSINALLAVLSVLFICQPLLTTAQSCGSAGLAVQVLGSGGPEAEDKRASTSYLIWENGRTCDR